MQQLALFYDTHVSSGELEPRTRTFGAPAGQWALAVALVLAVTAGVVLLFFGLRRGVVVLQKRQARRRQWRAQRDDLDAELQDIALIMLAAEPASGATSRRNSPGSGRYLRRLHLSAGRVDEFPAGRRPDRRSASGSRPSGTDCRPRAGRAADDGGRVDHRRGADHRGRPVAAAHRAASAVRRRPGPGQVAAVPTGYRAGARRTATAGADPADAERYQLLAGAALGGTPDRAACKRSIEWARKGLALLSGS